MKEQTFPPAPSRRRVHPRSRVGCLAKSTTRTRARAHDTLKSKTCALAHANTLALPPTPAPNSSKHSVVCVRMLTRLLSHCRRCRRRRVACRTHCGPSAAVLCVFRIVRGSSTGAGNMRICHTALWCLLAGSGVLMADVPEALNRTNARLAPWQQIHALPANISGQLKTSQQQPTAKHRLKWMRKRSRARRLASMASSS